MTQAAYITETVEPIPQGAPKGIFLDLNELERDWLQTQFGQTVFIVGQITSEVSELVQDLRRGVRSRNNDLVGRTLARLKKLKPKSRSQLTTPEEC